MILHKVHKAFAGVILLISLLGCESDYKAETILDCPTSLEVNFNLKQLHEIADETATEIRDTLIVSATVISNDHQGNMFNELYLQNSVGESEYGIRIEMEFRDSHLRFPVGTQVFIKLNELWLQKKSGVLTLGKPIMFFGNESIGRIPYHELDRYLLPGCELNEVQPVLLGVDNIQVAQPNTLVQLGGVEFIAGEIGLNLAEERTETIRHLTDCKGMELRIITSGYADFYDQTIPDAHGMITGILLADKKGPYLRIRGWDDIAFDSPRCRIPVEPVTSNTIFISEIADPDNAPEARFIELYNTAEIEIPLEGWQLVRYTNANTEPGSATDLSGHAIGPMSTFTVVADSVGFTSIFNVNPDLEAGKNSAADSNGDDTLLLMDPFGSRVDILGRIGEDGSGTDHEFEDGRALRKSEINRSNPDYSPSEWVICNDTGGAGTINEPKEAPQDFSPGIKD